MANESIFAAFERLWQHVLVALDKKANTGHGHTPEEVGALPLDTSIPVVDATLKNSGQAADSRIVGDKISDLEEAISNIDIPEVDPYEHPTHKSVDLDLYKVKVDSFGHVSETTKVTKSDIVDLGIPGDEYVHPTHNAAPEGLYKIIVDNLGHVESVANAGKDDIGIFTTADEPTNAQDGDIWIDIDDEYSFDDFVSKQELEDAIATVSYPIDTTLKNSGEAADAKVVGDKIKALTDAMGSIEVSDPYEHPEYAAVSKGLYKIAVDGLGHVSSTEGAEKEDIGIFVDSTEPSNPEVGDIWIDTSADSVLVAGSNADTVDGKHAADFADAAEFATVKGYVGNKSVADQISDAISNIEISDPYTHPTHTSASEGLYKITVDSLGHVSKTSEIQKSDITALGIPAQDTVYNDTALANRVTALEQNSQSVDITVNGVGAGDDNNIELSKDNIGIFTSNSEPIEAVNGDIWIDLDEKYDINVFATKDYVSTAIAEAIGAAIGGSY